MGRSLLTLLFSVSVLAAGVAMHRMRMTGEIPAAKTVDRYWAETGLGPAALEELVDDDSCHSSQRYFLACVNAIETIAERSGLRLTAEGRLVADAAVRSDVSEKEMLEPWREFYSKTPKAAKRISFRRAWRRIIKDHVTEERHAAVTGVALNAFLSVFRDPHTYLIPVKYYEEVVSRMNSTSAALGVVMARSEDMYYLRKVIEGSPSAKAGLKRGDWILSVNGTELKPLNPQRMSELLRARLGEETRLEVRRGGKTFFVSIERQNSEIPTVTWRRLEGVRPVGLLTINKFARETCGEVKKALLTMSREGMRGLVLDVRDNTGGQMDEAACIVSLFVGPKKVAFRVRYLDPGKAGETYYGPEDIAWSGKVAVLINSGSASASEIVAGSLRDHGRAVLVGERTFGKGSFQEGEMWSRNRDIAFFQTKGFYSLPSGFSPQMRGIEPDVTVEFRDSRVTRESDQYVSSLNPPAFARGEAARKFDLTSCLDADEGGGDDPQMQKARTALFCGAVASGGSGGNRGAL